MQYRSVLSWAMMQVKNVQCADSERLELSHQLQEYFAGRRQSFRTPRLRQGTLFERAVWKELKRIPFGQTITYEELARHIGHPRAARAVGTALSKNPLPVMLPCHRVVPASRGIGAYAGGRARKRWLLTFERRQQLSASSSR